MILAPSIASANTLEIGSEIAKLQSWGQLHLDIEDGNFVPNITFGLKTIKKVAFASQHMRLDAHLMVTNPIDYIQPLAECGVKMIAAHIESLDYPLEFINRVHKRGLRAGLALNIKTPLSFVSLFADQVDYLLIMTSEPDDQDERFYAPVIQKVKEAISLFHPGTEIHVDGGLTLDNMKLLQSFGVDEMVLGRLAFCTDNHFNQLSMLKEKLAL